MVDCPHIPSSVCITSVNLSQIQILCEEEAQQKGRLRPRRRHSRADSDNRGQFQWSCILCESTSSPWLCLSCGRIFCGRYVNRHALQHFLDEQKKVDRNCGNHGIAMECNTSEVYCYQCDEYAYGDTEDGKIESVRQSLAYFRKTRFGSDLSEESDEEDTGDLGTEEEDDAETKHIADTICQLDEESGSVPEDDITYLTTVYKNQNHDVPRSGPLATTKPSRVLRSRKRKMSASLSPSPTPPASHTLKHAASAVRFQEETNKYRGLRNLGNTCFMNSIIQALCATGVFRDYLTRLPMIEPDDLTDEVPTTMAPRYNTRRAASASSSQSEEHRNNQVVLAEDLRKVLINLLDQDYSSAVSPDEFFQTVWKISSRFRGFQQQDAHDFLRTAMDRIHSELRRCRIPESAERYLSLVTGGPGSDGPHSSVVSRLFEGTLQSQVVCLTCHTASNKHDPFMDLSLDIFDGSGRANNVHLSDCIVRFFAKEELSQHEQYMCGRCMDKRPSTKQLFIRVLPQVLCLHLKRFRWSAISRGKLDNMVDFPLTDLDMGSFMTTSLGSPRYGDRNVGTFDLTSLVVHHGSGVSAGHYTTYGLRNGSWYHFNDSTVKACSEQTVLKQKAYILFYTRCGIV